MAAHTALARARIAAENMMRDACTVDRVTGETVDPDTGAVTPTRTTLYTGKCRIQQYMMGAGSSPSDVGENFLRLLRLEVQLPISVVGLKESDRVTVTASELDPDLAGRVFTVRDLGHKTHATARRIGVQEVT